MVRKLPRLTEKAPGKAPCFPVVPYLVLEAINRNKSVAIAFAWQLSCYCRAIVDYAVRLEAFLWAAEPVLIFSERKSANSHPIGFDPSPEWRVLLRKGDKSVIKIRESVMLRKSHSKKYIWRKISPF